nr:uncharacterized protein CTRU02_10457 [Colletotrichum truncatum]KAF6787194.1 hypothetical protein CTRU02_10457 [Colletotrichum truncatum]
MAPQELNMLPWPVHSAGAAFGEIRAKGTRHSVNLLSTTCLSSTSLIGRIGLTLAIVKGTETAFDLPFLNSVKYTSTAQASTAAAAPSPDRRDRENSEKGPQHHYQAFAVLLRNSNL